MMDWENKFVENLIQILYRADQCRVPAGSPGGGQFASCGPGGDSGLPMPSKGYYRYSNSEESALKGVDYAMFAEGDPNRVSHYGDVGWEVDASGFPGEKELAPLIEQQLQADIAELRTEFSPIADLVEQADMYTVDGVTAAFFPENIVDGAGAFDNWEYTQWLWERVLEPRGIVGVRTSDGAIVFDPDLPTRFDTE